MRRNRYQVEMNFDGLTDSVTNLVGAMILLIVLLVGLTSPARPLQPGSTGQSESPSESDGPVDALSQMLIEAALIRAQSDQLAAGATEVEQSLAECRQAAHDLIQSPGE